MTAVSIVVPSLGGARRLPLLLDGLAEQTSDDFEVVVVLDGDVDDSAGVLAARPEPWLRTVVLPHNQGRAAALNAGFAAARGDILARCDDDLELGPTYVELQQRLHGDRAHGPRGLIGMVRNVYPERSAYARVYGTDNDAAIRTQALGADPGTRWRYWGGNVSVRREDYQRVGGYDTGFARYGWEDIDWGYRLARSGRRITVVPELLARHHVAATSTVVRARRAYDSGWSRRVFETKHAIGLDGALDEPRGTERTAWDRLVAHATRGLDHAAIGRRGERIDRSLRVLPGPLARKRVALLVEAAARAGYDHARREHPPYQPTHRGDPT